MYLEIKRLSLMVQAQLRLKLNSKEVKSYDGNKENILYS